MPPSQTIVLDRRILVVAALATLALVVLLWLLRPHEARVPGPPRIESAPAAGTTRQEAVFAFSGTGDLECALDAVRFGGCASPMDYGLLPLGRHVFMVRSQLGSGPGDVAVVHWTIVPGRGTRPTVVHGRGGAATSGGEVGFSIHGDLAGALSPGRGARLTVSLANPHPYAIEVTSLVVTVAAGSSKPGCDGRRELAVRQSSLAAGLSPVRLPPRSTVVLPASGATAPRLTMRDRPVNQDSCKQARFTIRYSGTARPARGD